METSPRPSPLALLRGHVGVNVITPVVVDHVAAIAAANHAAVAASQDELRAVGAARAQGVTWAEVGIALGVTRQAAWERFAAAVELLDYAAELGAAVGS